MRRLWMLLLLGLYAALVGALVAWWTHYLGWPGWVWIAAALGVAVLAQVLFLALPGKPSYIMPIRPRRLLGPALIGATLMGILGFGLYGTLAELLYFPDVMTLLLWPVVLANWLFWTIAMYVACKKKVGLHSLQWLLKVLIAGSLAELFVAVPSDLFFGRRVGCMTGLMTTFAVGAGFAVLLWAFGPGFVIILWLHPQVLKDKGRCPGCGYILRGLSRQRCPECGRPFTWQEIRATPEQMHFQS